ncbi:hypothetical protein GCM10010985_31210 [Caballeronia grimmiae]|uniref:Uncharacterized protein n=1 Tax=Caballeronia grimmiae TaxID=1071679 RepID=A0ABQ1RNX9_9BURK|nr:hypothetical protein GCM10010985_31210 [Caballeronia grimmiae]
MLGSWGNVLSVAHRAVALRTGVLTGMLSVLLSFVPAVKRIYGLRFGNPLMVGLLTRARRCLLAPQPLSHPVAEARVDRLDGRPARPRRFQFSRRPGAPRPRGVGAGIQMTQDARVHRCAASGPD